MPGEEEGAATDGFAIGSGSGSGDGSLSMTNDVSTALQSLEPSLRSEYDEAVATAPALVHNETEPLDFLRTDDMNATNAAIRLAKYWKYRKGIFEDQWLLPMVQTGQGTLNFQDIAFLRTGYMQIIKRPTGGPVCLVDMSRVPNEFPDRRTNLRNLFYVVTVMTDKSFQVEGITIVHLVTSAPRPPICINPEGWNIVRSALPMRAKKLIVAQAYEPWKEALLDYIGYAVARASEFRTGLRPRLIRGNSVSSILSQLEEAGVERNCVPSSHGGDYNDSKFLNWTHTRLALEETMSAAPAACINDLTQPQMNTLKGESSTSSMESVTQMQQHSRATRKRARGKRRSRASPSLAMSPSPGVQDSIRLPVHGVMTLMEQRLYWERSNRILRDDNARLEGLLEQAQMIVSQYKSTGEDDTADGTSNCKPTR